MASKLKSRWDEYVHLLDGGRWIVAHWDALHSEWHSSNSGTCGGMGQAYRYSYSRKLEGLAALGIRTYRTRSAALAAARRCYPEEA